tara:strand:+ start:907 stop:1257 length:351 start_codon:yes stop_codon:yes gene_type:complete
MSEFAILGAFNFIYLILYFVWQENFNNPYKKIYKIGYKKYKNKGGYYWNQWKELIKDRFGTYDLESKDVEDPETLNSLNSSLNSQIWKLNKRSDYALIFLALINLSGFGDFVDSIF